MKKIGILTFHFAHNYGALLQAYALKQYIAEKNRVEIINYVPDKFFPHVFLVITIHVPTVHHLL